jgi:hypothetical protein
VRDWKRPVAAIVGITVGIELVMIVTGTGPAVLLIAALCGLIGVVVWFIADLAEVALDSSEVDFERSGFEQTVRVDRRVMRLRSGLAYTRDDASLERLRTSLVELIDDQLRAVYHIDRADDPRGASAVLGPDLTTFVDDPRAAGRLARPSQVDRVLTLIEQI